MVRIEKDISILKKKLDACNEELLSSYRKLGEAILSRSIEDDNNALPLDANIVLDYHKLVEERAETTESILEIKAAYDRLTELSKFKKQIVKSAKEIDISLTKSKSRFALLFYKAFGDNTEFSSLDGYEDIEKIEEDIKAILEANEAYSEEKKEANFLAKFNLNRKIAGNKLRMSLMRKNIEKAISKRSEDIFNFLSVTTLYEKGEMQEDLENLYKKIKLDEQTKLDLDGRLKDIQEEETFLNDKMQNVCDTLSYSRQVANLSQKVKDLDSKIDTTLQKASIDFLTLFIEEDNTIAKDAKDSNVYSTYSKDIKEIASLRKELYLLNLNIEHCELANKKNSISNKIDAMNRVVDSCEEGIKSYQKRISSMKEGIEGSNKEISSIDDRLTELEATIKEG